ncbi:unnamed protein product [Bursaphelenchus xylophilus]|uniref:(pine wood nematode) hypothetical protein n=1 Tax=Bursaphelenchus xylophilus TaxID=6326 RepID=A0A1I7SUZ6_BURXY|nr:unnamed protein product [Bursaphelenchus xylophilus]CAG9100662.1 unnamed protein product [Bursaphelenchus xylophilus]
MSADAGDHQQVNGKPKDIHTKCLFCASRHHYSWDCFRYETPYQKFCRVQILGLCFRCFVTDLARECPKHKEPKPEEKTINRSKIMECPKTYIPNVCSALATTITPGTA